MPVPAFETPVVIWLDPNHPEFGIKQVGNIPDAISTILRYAERYSIDRKDPLLVQKTLNALVEADVKPTPANIHRANRAFLQLMKRLAPVPTRIRAHQAPRTLLECLMAWLSLPPSDSIFSRS